MRICIPFQETHRLHRYVGLPPRSTSTVRISFPSVNHFQVCTKCDTNAPLVQVLNISWVMQGNANLLRPGDHQHMIAGRPFLALLSLPIRPAPGRSRTATAPPAQPPPRGSTSSPAGVIPTTGNLSTGIECAPLSRGRGHEAEDVRAHGLGSGEWPAGAAASLGTHLSHLHLDRAG